MNHIGALTLEALISAQGCPEALIERMLRSATADFYRDTKAWRFTTEPASVTAGDRLVELDLPTNTAVLRVYWAKLGDKVLTAVSPRSLRDMTTVPSGYAVDGISNVLQLDVLPDRSYILDGVVANVALVPTSALDELPDLLFDQHRDGILYGAVAKLLAMPNVPWADMAGAQNFMAMAGAVRTEARRQAESQQAPVARKVRYGGI